MLNNIENLFIDFEEVYLFGSLLQNKISNDIDIILIYENLSQYIISSMKNIKMEIENRTNIPVDLTILSKQELLETKFLKKIKKY